MARPIKKGINYFNLDVTFFHDIKIRKIRNACGNQSIAILIYLLCNIYEDEGYYMRWDEDIRFLVADDLGAKESAVQDVVDKASAVGFFDNELFKQYHVLTSKRIQENYQLAAKQKKDHSIDSRYQLPKVPNADNAVFRDGNPFSSHDNPVSKSESTHNRSDQSKSDNNKPNKTKPRDLRDRIQQEFTEQVWSIYPKKRDFQRAYDAYYAAKVEGTSLETIVAKINEYKAYLKLHGTGEYYTKSLENWLGGRGWMDEYDMTPPKPKGKASNGRKEVTPKWMQKGASQADSKSNSSDDQQDDMSDEAFLAFMNSQEEAK
ncbi:DUF4373 domain-containing protein [Lactiplantibacillus plantarum]|uniref:DUF4373 domain-containing protein n=1 Tax=Lactiplantibacillus plantarum TaxID=1590 RepID=UPI00069764F8|nr:DUF4373 domain-containing protein [Lactiplantibacillus plantarum]KZU55126.1 prophage Lp1 protein 20 [Lactiplantibacillus plantarum]KZU93899.1 prophage Lp1 protein 20 [Lactiplantibacillus plantarum]